MRFATALLCAAVLAATSTLAFGTTHSVLPDGTGDFPTIKSAVLAAATGDTISLGDGVFTGDGNKRINFFGKALVVRSASGDPDACVIDCQGAGRGFYLASGEGPDAVIEGITVLTAFVTYPDYGGAALRLDGTSPTIRNCVFRGCVSQAGGAKDVAFGRAGAIYTGGGTPTITDCLFENNAADYDGGGVFATGALSPTLVRCTFRANSAESGGGGVFAISSSAPLLEDCEFQANTANYGAGMYATEGAAPRLTRCRFVENVASGVGGGLVTWSTASPLVEDCLFARNTASGGSGIYSGFLSSPTVRGCTFDGNVVTDVGGTVYSYQGADVTLENTIITGTVGGRAAYCVDAGVITAVCSDLFGNAGGDWTDCLAGQLGVDGNQSADPLYCDSATDDYHLDDNSPCAPANSPAGCGLVGAFSAGCVPTDVAAGAVPSRLRLAPAAPNPFNPTTTIGFEIPGAAAGAPMDLTIYDVSGRAVKTLVRGAARPGAQSVVWDGTGDDGRAVSSGVYLSRIRVGAESRTERLVLVR